MNQDKPTLLALWNQHDIEGPLLYTLAHMANVGKSIVENILLHQPVTRVDAIKVTVALSMLTGETWTLSNMDIPLIDVRKVAFVAVIDAREVPLIPTFRELCTTYQLDDTILWAIAQRADVSKSVLNVMYAGSPVERDEAEQVLAAISELVAQTWALSNTDIPVINTEEGHP